MGLRISVLGDIHGNVAALEAALVDIAEHRPDRLFITGDLVLNGPRPSETIRRLMELDKAGAFIVAGNTDIAVADGDYAAAFPWLDEVPAGHVAAAEWARDQLADDELEWLRRLPAERRLWADDDAGAAGPRLARQPDRRPVGRPRPGDHGAAGHAQRRPGAVRRAYPRRGGPRAGSQAHRQSRVPAATPWTATRPRAGRWSRWRQARSRRPSCSGRPTMRSGVADEVSARGLVGDVYRAATIRTGRFVR